VPQSPQPGAIAWIDLTVAEAGAIRDFYSKVAGWQADPVDVDGYQDYAMRPAEGEPVAGICHKRGPNAGLPSAWLVYITVADLDVALECCRESGGRVVAEPRGQGAQGRYAVIEDPAGAVCALFEPPTSAR
jgi:uncharacterized protein